MSLTLTRNSQNLVFENILARVKLTLLIFDNGVLLTLIISFLNVWFLISVLKFKQNKKETQVFSTVQGNKKN